MILFTHNTQYYTCTRFLCMHKILLHAQDFCACTTLLRMHKTLVHAQESCACIRMSCRHNIQFVLHNNEYCSERSDFLVNLHLHSRLRRIQWRIVKSCRTNTYICHVLNFRPKNGRTQIVFTSRQ